MGTDCARIFNRPTAFVIPVLLFVLIASLPSSAQQVSRWEVFGGYSFLRVDSPSFGFTDYSNLNGFIGGGAWNFTRTWSVATDVSGHYGSQLTVYNYMIGPQYSWRRQKSRFFAHALFGKTQNKVDIMEPGRSGVESVGRAFSAGGGFDWDITPRITIRVLQADYLNTNTFGATQNNFRGSAGILIRFGHFGRRRGKL